MNDTATLTWFDRALGAVYAPYKTKALQHRAAQQNYTNLFERDSRGRKDSTGHTTQPWGVGKIRKLTPYSRRVQVQQSREIYENNVLGHALIDRAVDNIIGEGMTPKPSSSDQGWNRAVSDWWRDEYRADAMGKFSNSELQRVWFRSYLRDGDIGAIMLRLGQVQTVETDYIQSPNNSGDQYGRGTISPDIVDGIRVGRSGQMQQAFIASVSDKGGTQWSPVDWRNFLFHANHDRANREAVRGVPKLSIIRPLLEQIDGTVEAVTMAYRMAASFGVVVKKNNPGAANNNLPTLGGSNTSGQINKGFQIAPAMVEHLNMNEDIVQVKPEHPIASFESYMTMLVRFAGIPLGLPLELAMLDFSKTNYSSARASLEQSYRSFRVEQKKFADNWLTKWYPWRIAKAVNMGEIDGTPPADYLNHKWMAPPWPFLNPVDDAQGVLAATDAGMTTLTDELAKRGYTLEEWLEMKSSEINQAEAAGVPLMHSSVSRESATATNEEPNEPNEEPEQPDDQDDE